MYIIACRAHFWHLPGLGQVGHSPRGTSGSPGTLDWGLMWSGFQSTCYPPMPSDTPYTPYWPLTPLHTCHPQCPLTTLQFPKIFIPKLQLLHNTERTRKWSGFSYVTPNAPWHSYTPVGPLEASSDQEQYYIRSTWIWSAFGSGWPVYLRVHLIPAASVIPASSMSIY